MVIQIIGFVLLLTFCIVQPATSNMTLFESVESGCNYELKASYLFPFEGYFTYYFIGLSALCISVMLILFFGNKIATICSMGLLISYASVVIYKLIFTFTTVKDSITCTFAFYTLPLVSVVIFAILIVYILVIGTIKLFRNKK